MEKVLLITLGVGAGHNSAANALAEQFELGGHATKIINFYEPKQQNKLSRLNQMALKHFKPIFNAVYKKLITKPKPFPKHVYQKQVKPLSELIDKFKPTKIVCTHLFGVLALKKLKSDGFAVPPFFYCVTDYYPYPYAESCKGTECVFAPNEWVKQHFLQYGIKSVITGIPVLSKFFVRHPKPQKPTILITGGGLSLGNKKAVKLCKNFHCEINIANGKNNDMPKLMQGASLILGKPGGLTCTEAMASGTPLVTFGKLALNEFGNIKHLEKLGMGFYAKTKKQVLAKIKELLLEKKAFNSIQNNAAKQIAEFVIDGKG